MIRRTPLFLALLLLSLTACQMHESLSGGSPDEFRVTKHDPLETPPDFKLRDPKDLVATSKETKNLVDGRMILVGEPSTATSSLTGSDQSLLEKAHVGKLHPTVRKEIEEENHQLIADSKGSLFGKRKGRGKILNPDAELKRLNELKEKGIQPHHGKPATYDRGSDKPSDNL